MAEPTRGLTRAASHGVSRRSEDSDPEDQDGYGFPSDPYGVLTPLGWSSSEPTDRPKPGGGPPCAFVPLQRRVSAAPHREVVPAGRNRLADCYAMLPLLSFRCPTTHSWTGGSASVTADPSAAACHVWGLDTPFAAYTTSPTDARSVGASMGFAPQGVLLVRERCPSRGPCPPDVSALRPTSPRGRGLSDGRLQGLVPATSSCCHRVTEATRPSMPSRASPLQSFRPIRPGDRL